VIAFLGSSSNEQNKKFHGSCEMHVLEKNSLLELEHKAMLNGCAPVDNAAPQLTRRKLLAAEPPNWGKQFSLAGWTLA